MGTGIRFVTTACVAMLASACGFIGLDGLTGGDAGRPAVQGPIYGDDQGSSSSNGQEPGDAADGATSKDSETAAPDAGSEATTWCMQLSPVPAFCADYDEGQLLGAFAMGAPMQVPAPTVDEGGILALTTSTPSSPPASFVATTSPVGDASVQARFENPVTLANADGATLRFDMRIDQDDSSEGIVADVFFDHGSSQVYAQLILQSTGGSVRWQDARTTTGRFAEPKQGDWTKDVELTASVSTGNVQLRIGGTVVASAKGFLPFSTADSATFYLGLHVFAGSKQVAFDDVVFTPSP